MSEALEQRRVAVIGWPVAHSRSPLIHNYWLDLYGIPGRYERIPVKPDDLAAFIAGFASRGLIGCNVTVPHKEQVARLVRIADPETQRLGSVNTLWMEGGTLHATSTDGYGFLANLREAVPDLAMAQQNVLILGAGGAARPVIAALQSAGARRIRLANRTAERAVSLARELGATVVPVPWNDIPHELAVTSLLVNATSLGMTGSPPLVIDLARLPRDAVVLDLVYVPLETDLLRQARARGHRCVDGLGMLLHQAVPGFERWFGRRPEVTPELRALVVRDLAGR
jgi:shikimate dehydrogenase